LTDEVKALLSHFEAELTVLNSSFDDLDSRVETLRAQCFSATTSLRVNMAMLLGGTRYTRAGAEHVSFGKRNLFCQMLLTASIMVLAFSRMGSV